MLILLCLVFMCEASFAYIVNSKMAPYSIGWWLFYISPWIRVFDYSAGLIAGLIFISVKVDSRTTVSKILFSFLEVIVLAVFASSIYYARFVPNASLVMSAYYVPFSVILVFGYAFQKGWMSWLLTRNVFVYLGNLSFTFFMLHQIVILYVVIFFSLRSVRLCTILNIFFPNFCSSSTLCFLAMLFPDILKYRRGKKYYLHLA